MAESEVSDQDMKDSRRNIEALDQNYETLKTLAKTAVIEFDDLKRKCKDYYIKYQAEHERCIKAKGDLDRLKNISTLALDEYENLQRKYHVESECRDKAVEIASKVVNQNKQLKRQSQMILTQISGLNGEGLDLADLQSIEKECSEDSGSESAVVLLQEEIKDLKSTVEDLKTELRNCKSELSITEEGFSQEKKAHQITRKKMATNEKQLKQLNRVSVMAFEEFNVLQTRYEVETQCRAEAEKLAVEAKRADKEFQRKSLILKETANQDERLAKAFEEISKLNEQLEKDRQEKEEKIKGLNEELTLSKEGEYLKGMKDKLDLAQEEIENLENQLIESGKKAKDAENKVEVLEKKLDNWKRASVPSTPPPPPPPPAPPPPITVMKKFRNIMGPKKKKGDNKGKKPDDPLANAMKEMMDRINSGKVQLKRVQHVEPDRSSSDEDAPAMSELGSLLSTLKKSSSSENLLDRSPKKTDKECEWNTIKLRKRSDQSMPRQASESIAQDGTFEPKLVLRKPRSQSTGDLLNDRPQVRDEATSELRKILQKQKAVAERESDAEKNKENSNPEETVSSGSDI